jgi:hypothetical protein
MHVRKTTFEQDLMDKEEACLKLTGEERIKMMRIVSERLRKPGVNYELKNQKVHIKRLS